MYEYSMNLNKLLPNALGEVHVHVIASITGTSGVLVWCMYVQVCTCTYMSVTCLQLEVYEFMYMYLTAMCIKMMTSGPITKTINMLNRESMQESSALVMYFTLVQ